MKHPRIFGSFILLSIFSCSQTRATSDQSAVRPVSASAATAQPPLGELPKLRLGDTARPRHYAVDLTIIPAEENFAGRIDIDLELREPKTLLWLNATELEIRGASVQLGAESIAARPVPGDRDFVGIAFDRTLPAGVVRLRLEYVGKLSRTNSNGLFKQKDGDNWYVFSHFEPIDARRAFPCFDEPEFKVPWQVTLHVKKDDVAVANTPAVSEALASDGMKTVKFAETRPLPSYLIALGVGPFEFVDAGKTARKGAAIRIITPRGRAAEAQYAAKITPQIIAALEDYFGSPYPYEKLDQIAVVQIGGAMENAGLVTYSQLLLLMKPGEEVLTQERRYASVCAHELAHMWFGDLVTMKWWNDTWLNEAFATWMADKIVDQLWPQWEHRVSRLQVRSGVMDSDGLMSVRKIRQPIDSKNDISNSFDQITYTKGGAVLSMFESWVGTDAFRRGVQRYLKKHAWGNASAEDFLSAVSAEAGRDVFMPFSTFLDQPGLPLVSIELRCEQGAQPKLQLSQQRYLPLGSMGSPDQSWQIPVCVRYGRGSSEGRQCMLLSAPAGEMALETKACPDWVLGNDEASGYYRVALLGKLPQLLMQRARRLPASDRLGIFGDIQATVRAGKMPAGEALTLIPRLVADANRHLISSVSVFLTGRSNSGLRIVSLTPSIGEYLVSASDRRSFAQFVQRTFGPKARALGWKSRPGEKDDTRLLRTVLVSLVADFGEDKALIDRARALTDRWLQDRKAIEPEMVDEVLKSAAAQGDPALFDGFYREAKREPELKERMHLFRAMSGFRDPHIIERALRIVLSDEFDSRETMPLLFGEHRDPATQRLAYDFVRQNFDALAAKLPRDSAARFPTVAMRLCDDSRRAEIEEFFRGRSTSYTGGPRILDQALEQLSLCGAYRKAQQPSVAAFLKKFRSSS